MGTSIEECTWSITNKNIILFYIFIRTGSIEAAAERSNAVFVQYLYGIIILVHALYGDVLTAADPENIYRVGTVLCIFSVYQ